MSSNASNKPTASTSLDLDNKWVHLKKTGNAKWESLPSYFDICVPRILDFFDKFNIKSTVFVVGQDAVLEKNHDAIRSIAEAGHEIANHSFHHEPWLHLYTTAQLEKEFDETENSIENITGQKPIGFRGPGFSLSNEVLRTLMRRSYVYDCSTCPSYLGPLARLNYFIKSILSEDAKEDRKELVGKARHGFQSNEPYQWTWRGRRLIEVPVTTMPFLKSPIHGSYILYLGKFSTTLAKMYFWTALKICKLVQVEPSLLLHPLDFMGQEDDDDLAFFPGMNQPAQKKINLLSDCLGMLLDNFEVVNMKEHVRRADEYLLPIQSINKAPDGLNENFLQAR